MAWAALLLASCAAPPRPTVRGTPPPVDDPPSAAVSEPDLGALPPAAEPPLAVPRRSHAVDPQAVAATALSYLGTPYRYGGDSRRGMDCSGLVYTVYSQHRVAVPRVSADQFGVGREVPPSRLRAGDLVFFADGRGRIQHVGICLDDDRFVHASSSRGVVEDSLRSRYFQDRFVGARRIVAR